MLLELERVHKKKLKKDETCPICGNPFLDDKYPLVVALPCHPMHRFDLECVAPWLKLHATCPLDRKELLKKEGKGRDTKMKDEDKDEEDGLNGMYY